MIERIGAYECVEALGGGATGVVYRAIEHLDSGIKREVALKVLPSLPSDDPVYREQFLEEARSIIALSGAAGRHIVQCYSCGIEPQTRRPWISMQLVPRSLESYIGEGPSDPETAGKLLVEVSQGLHAMHSQQPPLIHNDLKPGNVLVDELGSFLITDFGLARRLSDKLTLPAYSARYAAPEVHQHGAGTPASDLYSLGHIVYEFATGRRLFQQQFPSVFDDPAKPLPIRAWRDWHLSPQHKVEPLAKMLPGFDPRLSAVVERLMAKSPKDRYESAAQVLGEVGVRMPQTFAQLGPDVSAREPATRHEAAPAPRQLPPVAPIRVASKAKNSKKTTMLLAVFLGICAICAVAVLTIDLSKPPVIKLKGASEFVTATSKVVISGSIESMPADAKLECIIGDRGAMTIKANDHGVFTVDATLSKLGPVEGTIRVIQNKEVKAEKRFTLRRDPPKDVRVRLQTNPAVEGVALTIRPIGAPPIEARTDGSGSATCTIPYGDFAVAGAHKKYGLDGPGASTLKTGFEPELSIPILLRRTVFDVRFVLNPIAAGKGEITGGTLAAPLPISFGTSGPTLAELSEGEYRCRVELGENRPPIEKSFSVTRGSDNLVVIDHAVAEQPLVIGKPDRWLSLDAAKAAAMSDSEFLGYLRENAALDSIRVLEPRSGMRRVRIEGSVLCADDLERLLDRLKSAESRVEVDVKVNPDFVATALAERLRAAGVQNVQVTKVRSGAATSPAEGWKLKVDYEATPAVSTQAIRDLCDRYTLDPAQIDLRRPYK